MGAVLVSFVEFEKEQPHCGRHILHFVVLSTYRTVVGSGWLNELGS